MTTWGRRDHLNQDDRERAFVLLCSGFKPDSIAQDVHCHPRTVERLRAQMRKAIGLNARAIGRPRKG